MGRESIQQVNDRQKWLDHYAEKPASPDRHFDACFNHAQFLATIWDIAVRRRIREIVELGVGTGNLIQDLVHKDQIPPVRRFVEIDYNPHFLFANQMMWGNTVHRICARAECLPLVRGGIHRRNRLIFHQGLMEHYTDEEIEYKIWEQLCYAQTVVFSVPSDKFDFPGGIIGDERFLDMSYWLSIFRDSRDTWHSSYPWWIEKITGFSYGRYSGEEYHHCIIVEGAADA